MPDSYDLYCRSERIVNLNKSFQTRSLGTGAHRLQGFTTPLCDSMFMLRKLYGNC